MMKIDQAIVATDEKFHRVKEAIDKVALRETRDSKEDSLDQTGMKTKLNTAKKDCYETKMVYLEGAWNDYPSKLYRLKSSSQSVQVSSIKQVPARS